ncbi:MAG: hypothetical protein KDC73_00250 [Ignavibacteriae bacterium]|nr:hypothetical protein [Ignavibacteriota bacterium]MCB9242948.1 hypothetical protein [Ignavibacteriales bacterium]
MKQTAALKLLNSFTPSEQKEFKLFLASPAFVSRTKLKQLYEILLRDYPEMDESAFDKKKIYKKLFPDEYKASGLNSATLRHNFYGLQLAAEKFLVMKNVQSDDVLYNRILRRELRNRHLDKLYIRALEVSDKEFEDDNQLSSEYFLNIYDLLLEKKNFESMYSDFLIKRNRKVGIEEIDEIAKYLTYFFILELMYLNDGADKYAKRFDNSYEHSFINKLLQKIDITGFISFLKNESDPGSAGKLFDIYDRFFRLFEKADTKNYKDLKKYVLGNIDLLGTNTRSHIFFQFVKYCSINSMDSRNDKEFPGELFNILRIMADNGYYEHTEGTYFQIDFYRILFLMGCDEGEIDWTEIFLKKFAPKLPPEFRETAFNCGMAYVKFAHGKYDSALESLSKMKDEYFNLEIDKKILLIKIFYETGSYEQAISLINSMQRYIDESKKVSHTLKEKINNFLKLTLKLIKLSGKVSSRGDYVDLKYEIEVENKLRAKKWLMEKVG